MATTYIWQRADWPNFRWDAARLLAPLAEERVVSKARFWTVHAERPFNDRQRKALGKLLEGFEGFITTKKWCGMCGCSPDTAQRDIAELMDLGILERNPGAGRGTSYRFNWPPQPAPAAASEDLPTPPEDENNEGFSITPR